MKSPIRPISIRVALLVPITALVLLLGLVNRGLFRSYSEDTLQEALNTRCADLSREVNGRLHARFALSRLIVQSTLSLFRARPELLRDEAQTRSIFLNQLRFAPTLHRIGYALEDGSFLGAERKADGTFCFCRGEPAESPVLECFRTDATGFMGPLVRSEPFDARRAPWYAPGLASPNRPAWSRVYLRERDSFAVITAAQAIAAPSGKLLGVFAVDERLDRIGHYLREILPTPNSKIFLLQSTPDALGEHGLVASSAPDNGGPEAPRSGGDPDLHEALRTLRESGRAPGDIAAPTVLRASPGGRAHRVLVAPFSDESGLRWHLVTLVPDTDLNVGLAARVRRTLAGTAGCKGRT